MDKKIIIFCARTDGQEALEFFGPENVVCFIDNGPVIEPDNIRGVPVLPFSELERMYSSGAAVSHEVVMAYRRDAIWAVLSTARKLERIGAGDFSIWHDVKRRWTDGAAFIVRDRDEFPNERESLLEIKSAQLDYIMHHCDAEHIRPAEGASRKWQLATLALCAELSASLENAGIRPIMCGGTLIGAMRHGGFIPWDNDMDLTLINDEYDRMLLWFEERTDSSVFYLEYGDSGETIWKTTKGAKAPSADDRYICLHGHGICKIYSNIIGYDRAIDKNEMRSLPNVDIIHSYRYCDDYTDEMYNSDVLRYAKLMQIDPIATERNYQSEMEAKGAVSNDGVKVHYGHPHTGMMAVWCPGFYPTRKLKHIRDVFPLQKIRFETTELFAPAVPQNCSIAEGYRDYMSLPPDLPFDHNCVIPAADRELPMRQLSNIVAKRKG